MAMLEFALLVLRGRSWRGNCRRVKVLDALIGELAEVGLDNETKSRTSSRVTDHQRLTRQKD